jgi:hypothetical protein
MKVVGVFVSVFSCKPLHLATGYRVARVRYATLLACWQLPQPFLQKHPEGFFLPTDGAALVQVLVGIFPDDLLDFHISRSAENSSEMLVCFWEILTLLSILGLVVIDVVTNMLTASALRRWTTLGLPQHLAAILHQLALIRTVANSFLPAP